MQICTVTTLRDSPENVWRFILHNRAIGVTHQFLFFDDPTDRMVMDLAKESDLTATACSASYWSSQALPSASINRLTEKQKRNANYALRLAKNAGFDWIAHIDADEFINVRKGKNLPQALGVLDRSPNASWLMWAHEAIPTVLEHADPFTEIEHFRDASKSEIAENCDIEAALFHGQFLRGHLGKAISKVSETAQLSIHFAHQEGGEKLKPARQAKECEIILRHYESSSYSRWIQKWALKACGTAEYSGNANRNRQFRAYLQAAEAGEEELRSLYRRLYIPGPQCVEELRRIGVIVSRQEFES